MSEIDRAKEVLEAERRAVLEGLEAQRRRAQRAAAEQRLWRADVEELLDRGRAAGVPVVRMADALGVSRQWTTYLLARRERAERLRRVVKRSEPRGKR